MTLLRATVMLLAISLQIAAKAQGEQIYSVAHFNQVPTEYGGLFNQHGLIDLSSVKYAAHGDIDDLCSFQSIISESLEVLLLINKTKQPSKSLIMQTSLRQTKIYGIKELQHMHLLISRYVCGANAPQQIKMVFERQQNIIKVYADLKGHHSMQQQKKEEQDLSKWFAFSVFVISVVVIVAQIIFLVLFVRRRRRRVVNSESAVSDRINSRISSFR